MMKMKMTILTEVLSEMKVVRKREELVRTLARRVVIPKTARNLRRGKISKLSIEKNRISMVNDRLAIWNFYIIISLLFIIIEVLKCFTFTNGFRQIFAIAIF